MGNQTYPVSITASTMDGFSKSVIQTENDESNFECSITSTSFISNEIGMNINCAGISIAMITSSFSSNNIGMMIINNQSINIESVSFQTNDNSIYIATSSKVTLKDVHW